MSKSSLALNNLRGLVILIVLAFHSVLAYLGSLGPSPFAFDTAPFEWRAFPIVDSHRWFGFDLFCAWQDVYLMSLMFFVSALFTWSSLKRKHTVKFLSSRFQRLGVPYLVGVFVIMPLAVYPTYRVTAAYPSVTAYIHHYLALPFWPNGPLWFLWQLLAFTVLAAALYRFAPSWVAYLARRSSSADTHPARYFAAMAIAGALVYVPMALIFTPWSWSNHGLLAVQYCRPSLYGVFYLAGLGVGANGLDRGLLAPDGLLARRWTVWLAAALGSLLLWMGLTKAAMDFAAGAPLMLRIAVDLSFVVACASGCFFVIGACLRFGAVRSRVLDNLAENAFGMYLFHYPFVVWLQFALLGVAVSAVGKGLTVFTGAVVLAWAITSACRLLPWGSHLVGVERRLLAKSTPSPALEGTLVPVSVSLKRDDFRPRT
jgi:glucans biosynthesis protein C